MDIADFLELERAFKCYWIVGPTAEIQYVSCHRDLGGDRLDRVLISKGSIERGGRFSQMLDDCMLILDRQPRSEEHTSELQSLMRISYAVFCLKKKNTTTPHNQNIATL